ncbi:MAG TPA: hypothetical protein VMG59_02065 [Phycisphaerae bacterium]|nr:hypothetical protein [Phycisphaerae bacterium]
MTNDRGRVVLQSVKMILEVARSRLNDIYKDIARIPESYRCEMDGRTIPEGRICKVSIGDKHALLSIRGQMEHNDPKIHLDEKTRKLLGVSDHDKADVRLHEASWIGQFLWAWNATDPGYRIASRVAAVSIFLSLLGLLAGIAGIIVTFCHK